MSGNSGAGTFSTPIFVTQATMGNVNATLPIFFPPIETPAALDPVPGFTDQLPSSTFAHVRGAPRFGDSAIPCMVPESADLAASETCKGGRAFAVRNFESMRQLPRRYR